MEQASLDWPDHNRIIDSSNDNQVEGLEDEEHDAEDGTSEEDDEADEVYDEAKEEEFKRDLQNCLDNISHSGTFSSFTTTGVYINPGLEIESIGTIGLPLSARDAQAIARVCKQSPFGKGDETVVDQNVRKTWELDVDEFACCNPAWQSYLDRLSKQATQNLGVEVAASAQAYKLLLYEEGAFFKAHRDTEKVPGMFGTLVICLPSEHSGGEVQLVHNGKQKTLATAATSAYDLSALAWYSDVQHEIKPVTSGYRLVLTYNLVQDETFPRQTATRLDASASELEELLQTWDSCFSHQEWFAYPLEHRYTPASLSLKHLKGQDAARGRLFEQFCAKNGVYWFLGHMTKEKQVDEDEGIEDFLTDVTHLRETVTPAGKSISLRLDDLAEDRILYDVEDLYGDRDADSEDEEEFTGNASAPATLRYHDTVAILMRKEKALGLFITHEHGPASLLAMFELISNDNHCRPELRRRAMETLLRQCIPMSTSGEGSAAYRGYYLHSYLGRGEDRVRRREQYAQVFETLVSFCYANDLGDAMAAVLRDAMEGKNWYEKPGLVSAIARQIAKEAADGKQDVWSSWLCIRAPGVLTFKYVKERRQTFDMVKKLLPPSSSESFDEWKERQLNADIAQVSNFNNEDAIPLVNLLLMLGQETFFDSIMPKIVARPDAAGVLRLMYHLGKRTAEGDEATRVFTECRAYKQLLPILMRSFKLSVSELTTQSHQHWALRYYQDYQIMQLSSSASEFLGVVQRCMYDDFMRSNFKCHVRDLLASALPNIPTPGATFETDWRSLIFFLTSLVDLVQSHNDTGLNEVIANYMKEAFKSVASHFANARPKEPRDWSRPNAQIQQCGPCRCGPCQELSKFLIHPVHQTASFVYRERIRKHLQTSLNNSDFRFETDRRGVPHTLLIHKTTNEYQHNLQQWKNDVARFRKELTKLRSGFLFDLLGGDVVVVSGLDESLIANCAAHGMEVYPVRPLQPTSSSAQNGAPDRAVVGVKRKAEVVDLTEDYPL